MDVNKCALWKISRKYVNVYYYSVCSFWHEVILLHTYIPWISCIRRFCGKSSCLEPVNFPWFTYMKKNMALTSILWNLQITSHLAVLCWWSCVPMSSSANGWYGLPFLVAVPEKKVLSCTLQDEYILYREGQITCHVMCQEYTKLD